VSVALLLFRLCCTVFAVVMLVAIAGGAGLYGSPGGRLDYFMSIAFRRLSALAVLLGVASLLVVIWSTP